MIHSQKYMLRIPKPHKCILVGCRIIMIPWLEPVETRAKLTRAFVMKFFKKMEMDSLQTTNFLEPTLILFILYYMNKSTRNAPSWPRVFWNRNYKPAKNKPYVVIKLLWSWYRTWLYALWVYMHTCSIPLAKYKQAQNIQRETAIEILCCNDRYDAEKVLQQAIVPLFSFCTACFFTGHRYYYPSLLQVFFSPLDKSQHHNPLEWKGKLFSLLLLLRHLSLSFAISMVWH